MRTYDKLIAAIHERLRTVGLRPAFGGIPAGGTRGTRSAAADRQDKTMS